MHIRDFDPTQLERGKKSHLWLDVCTLPEGNWVRLPVLAVKGNEPGPTLVVFAAVHGDEYEGIQAIPMVYRQLNPAELRGTYLAVPIANPPAFAAQLRSSPLDGANMARIFPGDPNGTVSYRIAYYLREKLIAHADFFLDLHSAGVAYSMPMLVGYLQQDNEAGRKGRAAALAFGTNVIWGHPTVAYGRTVTSATELNIPWLYTEAAGGGRVAPDELPYYVNGQFNLMKHLGMLAGTPNTAQPQYDLSGEGNMDIQMTSKHAGFFVPEVKLLDAVQKGQLLGRVLDAAGETLDEIRADGSGFLVMLRGVPKVVAGEMIAAVTQKYTGK